MKKKKEFSKVLLIQESALIWVMTLVFLALAGLCIIKDYMGSLPWLTAMISFPWTAYGVSQCFYYNKSKKENTAGGIKYDTIMKELTESYNENNLIEEYNNEQITDFESDINLDYGV